MRHYLHWAKHIYETRCLKGVVKTSVQYARIKINNLAFRARYGRGTRVMAEDGDNLILLDACRSNIHKNRVEFDGKLQSRISLGSASEEFIERNFGEQTCHDTMYVNANSYLPRLDLDNGTFHAVVNKLDEWDPVLETVNPETVVETPRKAHSTYSEKRIIAHFMQPHLPFIGKYGQRHQDQMEYRSVEEQVRRRRNEILRKAVCKAVTENLSVLSSYITTLLDSLWGKTVISSAHWNSVDERKLSNSTKRWYGNLYGAYTLELVKVPWFVIASYNRRTIEPDPPVTTQTESKEVIERWIQPLAFN